ncbi:MAG TPA: glycosyltransferase [Mycobacteriales bacterium]
MTARAPATVAAGVRTLAVARPPGLTGPSRYPVAELVRTLERAGLPRAPAAWPPAARVADRLGLNRSVSRRGGRAVLVPLMGPAAAWLFPHSLTHECAVVCWDVWTPDDPAWDRLFRRHRVRFAVMTARTAAERWADRGLRTAWVPEAIDPPPGSPGPPLGRRRIDVLELGRRHPGYHAVITPPLARTGAVHRYERTRGEIVFPTRAELGAGLRDTVVSVCFPGSVTHPERSGDIETLTRRYLESMAAGTVLVGSAPAELVDLFGYDPVVPVDWDDPGRQLLDIVRDPERYAPLVARNYARFLEVGTLRARVPPLLDVLRSWGFRW